MDTEDNKKGNTSRLNKDKKWSFCFKNKLIYALIKFYLKFSLNNKAINRVSFKKNYFKDAVAYIKA